MKSEIHKRVNTVLVGAALLLLATNALAATTGTEFQPLFTWMLGEIQGYGGKVIALMAFIIGVMGAAIKGQPMIAGIGIAIAIFIVYVPTIITGLLTATI